tara:strand:+ start:722 stop:1243 length:522 start_codon:yes stop_codon:yes gene_type:complete
MAPVVDRDNAIVASEEKVNRPIDGFECTSHCTVGWPAFSMRPPAVPNHHAHFMGRQVERDEGMQVRSHKLPFEEPIAPSQNPVAVSVNGKPKDFPQLRMHGQAIEWRLFETIGSEENDTAPSLGVQSDQGEGNAPSNAITYQVKAVCSEAFFFSDFNEEMEQFLGVNGGFCHR